MRRVLNATGAVLHTNLGRAQLSPAAVDAVVTAAGATDVELDLVTGRRARRGRGTMAALRAAVPAAGDVHVVNNGAAGARPRRHGPGRRSEIVVSRGELVEIGDGFRLPDLLESTGARLREVGTTNRTSLADYRAALSDRTGFVLKVHPSNFVVTGSPPAWRPGNSRPWGFPSSSTSGRACSPRTRRCRTNPTRDGPGGRSPPRDGVGRQAALGGPQAGLLLGDAGLVERLRRHPLARALRVDKLTLAALEATVRAAPNPTRDAVHADPEVLPGAVHGGGGGAAAERGRRGGGTSAPSSAGVGRPGVNCVVGGLAPAGPGRPAADGDPSVAGRVEGGRCCWTCGRCHRRGRPRRRRRAGGGGMTGPTSVVATAGHVDHGKSSLVRALTGRDPDRYEEEKRRGLTIDLGYAWTDVPGRGTVAFVDVPGHERFVPRMLAGVGPVPVVLFVVAADGAGCRSRPSTSPPSTPSTSGTGSWW